MKKYYFRHGLTNHYQIVKNATALTEKFANSTKSDNVAKSEKVENRGSFPQLVEHFNKMSTIRMLSTRLDKKVRHSAITDTHRRTSAIIDAVSCFWNEETTAFDKKGYDDTLLDLSRAIAHQVMKVFVGISGKASKGDGNKIEFCRRIKNSIEIDRKTIENCRAELNKVGNDELSQDESIKIDTLCKKSLSDGTCLVDEVALELWRLTSEKFEKCPNVSIDVDGTYEKVETRKKVLIKDDDCKNLYETVETSIRREAYKACRREASNSGGIQASLSKYVYIEDIDNNSKGMSQFDKIYKRINQIDQYFVENSNGVSIADEYSYFCGEWSYNYTNYVIKSLKLSPRQQSVLKFRQMGYGYRAIATAFDIDISTVCKHLSRIGEKAQKSGFFNSEKVEKIKELSKDNGKFGRNLVKIPKIVEFERIQQNYREAVKNWSVPVEYKQSAPAVPIIRHNATHSRTIFGNLLQPTTQKPIIRQTEVKSLSKAERSCPLPSEIAYLFRNKRNYA